MIPHETNSLLSNERCNRYKLLSVNVFVFYIDSWHRIKFVLYVFTYFFGITFCISKPYYLVIITNAKYQCAALTIGKGRYTFEPAFRSLDLKHLFLVVGCCFAYK